jgi:type I restriction enzyme S subunit
VSGRLTEGWRGDDTYGSDGYPLEWDKKGFSEFGKLARGKSKHRPRNDPKLFGDEYPFIQTGEVANSDGEITCANKFYSEFGLSQSRLFPVETLCITIAANIADTAILKIDACFPDSVVGFTPKEDECAVKFVKYLVDVNKENLDRFAPATAQKNINLKVLNELRLPFPSLTEQIEIVRQVDQLFTFADQIEQRVKDAQSRVNHFTQSILAKAFRGELTAEWREQNPDLICGENSAQALLARIKAEQAKLKPKKKARKKSAA